MMKGSTTKRRIVSWAMACLVASALLFAGVTSVVHRVPTVSAESKGVSLTVYNQNLALVRDLRTETLKAGFNELRFGDVAAQIDPTSVLFRSLSDPAGTRVLEQNFEYDLVSPDKLLQKYVDQTIGLVTRDNTVYTGTLLSANADIILQSSEGSVAIVKADAIREVNFPALPGGLITKPTLVWMLDATAAGEQDIEVTYLTYGINWNADYVVQLAADDETVDLNGWITLDNRSGATYEDATLKLVAGDIHRVEEPQFALEAAMEVLPRAMVSPSVEEREFFEYHLYEVQRPVTVRDNQTKQIEFATAQEVAANKFFVYDGSQTRFYAWRGPISDVSYGIQTNTKVMVMLEIVNSEEAGLGIPLPKGRVRVYQADTDDSAQLVGEDYIDHTPRNETVRLYLGDAFDIVGERVQTDFKSLGKDAIEESFQITVRNRKTEDIIVKVVERLYRWSEWEITQESVEHKKVDAQTVEWELPVAEDGEATITYSVLYRW